MVDCFPGLRHDAIVSRDDEDDDVRDLGTAGAHQGERGVARRVEEDDLLVALFTEAADQVGADVLGDAAGFTLGNARLSDRVEQRRLAVVHVAHDRDHGCAGHEVLGIDGFRLGLEKFLLVGPCLDFGPERARDLARRVHVDGRVDSHHHPAIEKSLEDLLHADVELVGEILDGHSLGQCDGARDRRRRDRRGRRRHPLQRIAPLRGALVAAGRARPELLPVGRPLARHARTRRQARLIGPDRLRRQRAWPAQHRRRHPASRPSAW